MSELSQVEAAVQPGEHFGQFGRYRRCCPECGTEFRSGKQWAEFCATDCRKEFNNRRLTRGVALYDLFMVMRYDRPAAKLYAVWKLLCRMAQAFRDEDLEQRAGRKSWREPRAVLERHAYLQATVVARATWKRPNVS